MLMTFRTVVQILAEPTVFHESFQIDIRRSNDPRIDLDGVDATKTHEFLFLDNSQELGLRLGADRPNLIEKDRA